MPTSPDARRALLARLVDHAPLFPPASLPLEEALAEDARASRSPHAFVLARFVCPASLLERVTGTGRGMSAVLDAPIPAGVEVEAVEARFRDDLASLEGLAEEVYVEVPLDDALEERLDAIAAHGFRAKVRCGGREAPTRGQLAAFLRGCRSRGLVFKATAGLHHAVRANGEHGLLNLLAAVVFGDEEAALSEADAGAFALDAAAFSWRERSASAPELAEARSGRLHAIGSCSFFEPVHELGTLGMLPA
jgi:hypothetical protein